METGNNPNPPEELRRNVRPKRKKVRRFLLLCLVLSLGALVYVYRDSPPATTLMNLAGEKLAALTGKKAPAKTGDVYICPMHPNYHSDKPGTCPICGMNLVKMEPEDMEDTTQQGESTPGTASTGAVKIGVQKQQLIGVRYGEAAREPLSRTIRAVAQLAYPETGLARVQAKVDGWIDKVFVDSVGRLVKKGDPLFSIYSPQLVSTQQELIIASKSRDQLGKSTYKEIASGALSLYAATRERLRYWDVSEAQINEIEKRGTPLKSLNISSPIGGFVVARNAYPGQRITPETELYTIADLSTIWAIADVYEYEIPMISLGQPADMTLTYAPDTVYKGKVAYISPEVDKVSRTVKVRLVFPNSDFKLKPDMYANVALKIDYGQPVSVPAEAVLDSGTAQTVFVAGESGTFEPRQVKAGPRVGDRQIILSGLTGGEKVVVSGNFLIDSESQLKAGLSAMGGGHAGHTGTMPADSVNQSPPPAPAPGDRPSMEGMEHGTPAAKK